MRLWWDRLERVAQVEQMPSECAEDVEAFLLGGSAAYYRARGEWVPPWAWLNAVAHGAPEAIDALRRPPRLSRKATGIDFAGAQAVASIASAVWWRTRGDHVAIESFQRRLLVPLELALMAGRVEAVDATTVAHLTLIALHAGRLPPEAAASPSSKNDSRSD